MKKTSKNGVRILAILWTAVAMVWMMVALLRLDDPSVGGGMKAAGILLMLASLAIAMLHWYRYTHYEDDEY